MSRHAPYAPEARGVPLEGLLIREAQPDDAPAISQVDALQHDRDPSQLEPLIRGELEKIRAGELPRETFLAFHRETLCGYGRVGWQDQQARGNTELPNGWYLLGVNVHPDWRRRGVGRALTERRLAWMRERAAEVEAERLWYFTGLENRSSVALHAPFGFRVEREVRAPVALGTKGRSWLLVLDL